jgi:hypothetical protein
MNYSTNFLDNLFLNRDRTIYTKIDLLSFDESKIKEIQGRVTSGSLRIESTSPIRRTLTLEFFLDKNLYSLSSPADEISINKKIQAFVGIKNNVYSSDEAELGEVIWFNLGIFVITEASFSHSINSSSISIQAQDKMAMLNGVLAGEIGADVSFSIGDSGEKYPYFYIIKEALTIFGSEQEQKVVINDIPVMIPNTQKATSSIPNLYYSTSTYRTFDNDGVPLGSTGNTALIINENDEVDVYIPFAPTSEFDFKGNSKVTDILERIKQDLFGIYNYYYDENGFFKFERQKEFSDSDSFQLQYLQDISNNNYFPSYSSVPITYDFSNKDIISSFSNAPQWRGIKNDFYVYGKNNILFHLAIDTKPVVPTEFYEKNPDGTWSTTILVPYNQPWQQFLIDQTEFLLQTNPGSKPSYYYPELKAFFEFTSDKQDKTLGIYKKLSATDGVWRSTSSDVEANAFITTNATTKKGIPSSWKYFFDILDEGAPAYNGFSISAIGRRIKSINDQTIETLYPVNPPVDSTRKQLILFDNIPFIYPKVWEEGLVVKNGDVVQAGVNFYIVSDISINGEIIPTGADEPTHTSGIYSNSGITYQYTNFLTYNQDSVNTEIELAAEGIQYYSILKSQVQSFLNDQIYPYANDAFSNIKNSLFTHTNYNESITISCVPIYTLDVNEIVNVLDLETQILGNYYIQSISFDFSEGAQMSIAAQKIY